MTAQSEMQGPARGVIGEPRVARISTDRPWAWLSAGWRDYWSVPKVSIIYGLIFTLASVALVALLIVLDQLPLVLPLAGGFLLLGPLLAVGLYETSRRLGKGEPIRFRDVLLVKTAAPGQIAFMGVILLIAFFAWVRLAYLIFALFHGIGYQVPPLPQFFSELLFTWQGLGMVTVGSIVGGAIAFIIFAMTAISVPMMTVRNIDAITAAITSFRAIGRNPGAMILWGWLIVMMAAFGIATGFIGLILTFPLTGYATWHAYRDLVDSERPTPEG